MTNEVTIIRPICGDCNKDVSEELATIRTVTEPRTVWNAANSLITYEAQIMICDDCWNKRYPT